MGNITPDLLIWTPDSDDLAEPDVYLATMAASIEEGTGERLRLQEKAIGLKASLASVWNLPSAATTVPYAVTASVGDFNNGFTFSGGVATVQTAGMYVVTGALSSTNIGAKSVGINLMKNSVEFAGSEVATEASWYISAQASCVVNCVAGDLLSVKGFTTPTSGQTTAPRQSLNYLSISMVQAVPV